MTTEKTANQRGAARLAAVQALYQMDLAGTPLADVLAEYEVYRLGKEIDGDVYLKADPAWFRAIVAGVVKDQKALDPKIADAISEGWTLARLDSTLRAILRAGVFEIMKKPDVPTAVIVTEYVEIATAFFEGDEGKLVNAVLDRIARRERGQPKQD